MTFEVLSHQRNVAYERSLRLKKAEQEATLNLSYFQKLAADVLSELSFLNLEIESRPEAKPQSTNR